MATLEISRQFNCSKEKLFEAWTNQEQLKHWWKPLGKELANVENEIKPSGVVKYEFENDGLQIDGAYEKVEEDLLKYSWHWHLDAEPIHDATYKLTVQFAGNEHTSSLNITQDGFVDEDYIKPHQQGWEAALEKLKTYLEPDGQTLKPDKQQHTPISGYMETPEQQKVGGG